VKKRKVNLHSLRKNRRVESKKKRTTRMGQIYHFAEKCSWHWGKNSQKLSRL